MSYIYIVMNEATNPYGDTTGEPCSAWSTAALAMQELADIAREHGIEVDAETSLGDSVTIPPTETNFDTDEYYVLTLEVDGN